MVAAPRHSRSRRGVRAVLYKRMVKTFPQLDGVRIGHAWGCKVAFSFDGIPHIGEQDGLHYIAGCNGNGVAMMNYLGHKIGRKIIERASRSASSTSRSFQAAAVRRASLFLPAVAAAYVRSIASIRCAPAGIRRRQMQTWTIGNTTVTRIEEQVGPNDSTVDGFLSGVVRERFDRHLPWMYRCISIRPSTS